MIEVRNLLATGEALEPVRGDVSGLDRVKRPGRTPGPVRASEAEHLNSIWDHLDLEELVEVRI